VARGPVTGIAFEPGEPLLVVTGADGVIAFVDTRTATIVHRSRPGAIHFRPTFSADGRLMVTNDSKMALALWPLRSGLPAGQARLHYPPQSAYESAVSPDGRTVAVSTGIEVEVLDVATLRRRFTLPGADMSVLHVRFTPDGRFIVGGSAEGWTRLWSASTGRAVTPPLRGHTGAALWEDTSPDGRTLATGSDDGSIRLYDLQTQRPLGAPLPGIANKTVSPLFSPDGAALFAITNAGRAYRWDIRPAAWAQHACAVAGRRLTRAEFADALPGRAYEPAC
jgi:WD40 repeat protein